MRKTTFIFFVFFISMLNTTPLFCQQKCVTAEGEALIINNDIPSAKAEALARAKWTAIENTVGTEIKAQSIVQNFTLVDDAIKTEIGGVVKNFNILEQVNKENIFFAKIRACIEPAKAREAVSALGRNNSIAVFIPARKPGRSGDEFEETNLLSETIIEALTDQKYTVIDIAPTQTVDALDIERAIKSGSTLAARSMMFKFFSNLIIIGKVDYSISTRKGDDIGYGISMPFNNVTVRLNYRIVARNNKTGNMEILTAGTESGMGMAISVEDAAAAGMKTLAQKLIPKILDKVASYIQGNVKKVRIKVNGVTDIDTNLDIKGMLQNTVWVTEVEEKQMGEFVVGYPENTVYLANSIKQKGNFKIVNFSPYSLILDYRK